MFRFFVFLIFITCYDVSRREEVRAQQRQYDTPLPLPVLLSGSFGELRENHFHTGIDLRTGGKVGIPVISLKEGVVSRVKVSSVGYGNALYVEHADGTTTVYAHLSRFTPVVTRIVRAKQYEKESFEVDFGMRQHGIHFKQGDTLAYTGNTGSSGGPHLHFEYRDTRTEAALNPLLFLKIQDNTAPKFQALYLYYMAKDGCVERRKRIVPKYLGNRKYACEKISVPAGRNGVGLYLTDVMSGSWSKLGTYKIEMSVEGEKWFEWIADTCLFECAPLVNEIKDYDLYHRERETVYRTFGHYVGRIPGVKIKGEGWFEMKTGEEKKGVVKVADRNGNEAELRFTLAAKDSVPFQAREVLDYKSPHVLHKGGYKLLLGDTVLFTSLPRVELTDTLTMEDGKLYTVFTTSHEEQPLLNQARLEVEGDFDKTDVICRVVDKKTLTALATCRDEKGLFAYTGFMGQFTVEKDTAAPEIEYKGISDGKLHFMIRDELSGIAAYRGEVARKWVLFEYDAKNDLLVCSVDEPVFVRGQNEIKLLVRDKAGNIAEKQIVFRKGK